MQLRIPFQDGLNLGSQSGLALARFIVAPAGTA